MSATSVQWCYEACHEEYGNEGQVWCCMHPKRRGGTNQRRQEKDETLLAAVSDIQFDAVCN